MTNSVADPRRQQDLRAITTSDVTCPFCGLLCDDLEVESKTDGELVMKKNGCDKAINGFGQDQAPAVPAINGKQVSLDEAVKKAAKIIKASSYPLFSGMATDVSGVRAVIQLADRCGGLIDHMLSAGMLRNFNVLQDSGWVMTTLGEFRNRADLIIFAGTDAGRHPRFFERCVWNTHALYDLKPESREIVFLGDKLQTSAGISPTGRKPTVINCDIDHLGEVFGAINALLQNSLVNNPTVGGAKITELKALLEQMRAAQYGVIVWEPATLNSPHADLTVQAICRVVNELNKSTRFAGFTLGGDEGAATTASVCAWQTGYPIRTSFGRGYPEFLPERGTSQTLANQIADALIWISAFSTDRPAPATELPSIVLGRPGLETGSTPSVFIPVGTPGLDHGGTLVRCDNVVSLPVRALRDLKLRSVAQVINQIYDAL